LLGRSTGSAPNWCADSEAGARPLGVEKGLTSILIHDKYVCRIGRAIKFHFVYYIHLFKGGYEPGHRISSQWSKNSEAGTELLYY
jgi:hypothetical protein